MFDERIADAKIIMLGGQLWATVTIQLDENGVEFYLNHMPIHDGERDNWNKLFGRFIDIRNLMKGER